MIALQLYWPRARLPAALLYASFIRYHRVRQQPCRVPFPSSRPKPPVAEGRSSRGTPNIVAVAFQATASGHRQRRKAHDINVLRIIPSESHERAPVCRSAGQNLWAELLARSARGAAWSRRRRVRARLLVGIGRAWPAVRQCRRSWRRSPRRGPAARPGGGSSACAGAGRPAPRPLAAAGPG